MLPIQKAYVFGHLVHPPSSLLWRMHLADVAENEQECIMKEVFCIAVVGGISAALCKKFVVYDSVEASHGLPVTLLTSTYQLLHPCICSLRVAPACSLFQNLDTSRYLNAPDSFTICDRSSQQVIVLL